MGPAHRMYLSMRNGTALNPSKTMRINIALFAMVGLALLAGMNKAVAQDPTSVDVDLRQSTADTNNLEVYVRANGSFFDEVFSGLTFTIRWVTTSPATLGTRVNSCPAGISIAPTAQVTNPDVNGDPTGYNYRSFNAFGSSLLSDAGCPLPQDTWFLVTTIPVENDPGCTEFQIVNDTFTSSPGNARDFFVSLGGVEKTGVIEPTAVNMGACAPDCLGVPGGSAVPGTPCDDGDPDTMGETFSPACICLDINTTILEAQPLTLSLSPGPNDGLVSLRIGSDLAGAFDLRVFDPMGRLVHIHRAPSLPGSDLLIDLSDVASGCYLLVVDLGGRHASQRFVKR